MELEYIGKTLQYASAVCEWIFEAIQVKQIMQQ